MAKKRQLDFQKTHLKPGRPVGRRKNITSTSIKSKKISVPNKARKEKSQKTIPECLKNIRDSTVVALRVSNLNQLITLIHEQKNTWFLYLSEIMESVFKIILELDDSLRNAALQVIITLLKATNDSQIHSFVTRLLNVLSCAMTHSSHRIKTSSLALLNCMLNYHPDLICHSMNILINLLEMASEPPRIQTQKKSTLPNLPILGETVYSSKYQINILGHMNVFLKEMLKNKSFLMDEQDRDEQEVYWDCKSPLNLPIYAGGGLQPVDIEKSYSNNLDDQDAYFDDSGEIEKFIHDVIKLLPAIYIEEISSECKSSDTFAMKLFCHETIKNLSILFQVFSSVAEWAKLISYDEMDNTIKKFLWDRVSLTKSFPFETNRTVGSGSSQFEPLVQLNLAVCFLYGNFLAAQDKDYSNAILMYVKSVLEKNEKAMPYEIKYQSIPMLVKIIKIYFSMKDNDEFLQSCLPQLCSLLRTYDDRPNKKLLISLFAKISLNSAYNFLTESNAMKYWFSWLMKEIFERKHKHLDKKLLNIIKKIANCRYPCFLEILSAVDVNTIKNLLKNGNDDVRDTVIFLIYNMKDISEQLLEVISRTILLEPSFPKKYAIRLIRLLMYRFSDKSRKGQFSMYHKTGFVNFTLFLLNIAIDSYNLYNDKMVNFESNEYTRAMKPLKDGHAFNIFPSLRWEEHSVLFNVCVNYLNQLPQKAVSGLMVEMFKEVLNNTTVLPVHSAIAMLKLNNREENDRGYEKSDVYYPQLLFDLTFSCLLSVSVLTHMPTEDEWYKQNVLELMNSMELTKRVALQTMEVLDGKLYVGKPEGIVVYHILRICNYFVELDILESCDGQHIIPILDAVKEKCSDKTMKQQPLFIQLYNFFSYYM